MVRRFRVPRADPRECGGLRLHPRASLVASAVEAFKAFEEFEGFKEFKEFEGFEEIEGVERVGNRGERTHCRVGSRPRMGDRVSVRGAHGDG